MTSKEDVELICLSDSEEDEIEAEIEDAEDIKTIAPEHKPQPEMICLDDSESEEEDDDEDDVDEHLVNLDPKEKRTKLFVNYLPQNLTDAELNTIFMNCGPIKECKVFRDVATDYSFGYGIVDFEDPLDAARALKTKNQIQIQDKKLTVNYSRDGQHRGYAKLFFQNIGDESEVKIRGIFDKFGEILQFKILDNTKSGFVRYANRFQAMLAIRTLNNEHLFKGSDVKLIVKFAEEHGKQKSAIYAHLLKKAKRWNNHKPYHRYTRRIPPSNGIMEEGNHVIYSYIQEPSEEEGPVVYQEEDQLQVVQDQDQNDQEQLLNNDVVLNQGQEVLVYDDETGEYQQYYYVPENQELDANPEAEQALEHLEESIKVEEPEQEESVQLNEEESEAVLKLLESEKDKNNSVKVLNQSDIHDLQPGTLIQCNKCWQTFLSAEFEEHYNTWHKEDHNSAGSESEFAKQKARDFNLPQEQVVIVNDPGFNKCAICDLPSRSKKEYLLHYKSRHQGYKLGCPKCSQTYHSPELLQVHFKHFHDRDTPIVQSAGTAKRAHVMLRCEYCDDIVEDLENHLIQVHELDEPTAIAVTQDRPLQVVLDPLSQATVALPAEFKAQNPSKPKTFRKPAPPVCLHCNICAQDFASQRDFTNHRRRKGYCRPLYPTPAVREEPKQIRRIGIIRKLIKR